MEEKNSYRMPLLGDMAPAFHAVHSREIDFPRIIMADGLFCFPSADFTPVCTTEFITFASMINEFKALNTELVGLSIDSIYSHIAWLRRLRNCHGKI